jgi:hypothetical protein
VETLCYQNFRCMSTGLVHCVRRNESFCRRSCLVFQGRIVLAENLLLLALLLALVGCCLEELIRRESCTTEEEEFGVVV